MSFDFINTTLTDATLSSSIATIGRPFCAINAPSGSLTSYSGLTCAVMAVAAGIPSLLISGSGFTHGQNKMFFLNGLLVSASKDA